MNDDNPQLVGRHVHKETATEKYLDGTFTQVIKTEFMFRDDEAEADESQAIKIAKAEGAQHVINKLHSNTREGLAVNSAVTQYRAGLFPNDTLASLAEKFGFLKQTLYAADKRLYGNCKSGLFRRTPDEVRAHQSEAAKDYWRRRKEKAGPPQPGQKNDTNENHEGLQ
jgi:hypothetical protein